MLFKKHIRFFEEDDWGEFKDFVKKSFHKKYILSDKDFLTWQYTPSVVKGKPPQVFVLFLQDKIKGFLGLIPLRVNYFNRDVSATCLANLMTDSALRGKGAGADFIEKAEETSDLLYTTGYTPAMSALYKRFGWKTDILLKRYVKILNPTKTEKLIGKKINTNTANTKQLSDHSFSLVPCQKFDQRVDTFWEQIKYKYKITISRSSEYLNWRYSNHPRLTYNSFIVTKNEVIYAFLVLRLEESKEGYKVGRIIDLISADEAEEFAIVSAVNYCKDNGADFADYFFTGNFHVNSLLATGFEEANKDPLSLLPIYFNPIRTDVSSINLAYKLINKEFYNKEIENSDNWYVTKGDGDQDRPNPH